jgi:hypothetical protein
VNPEGPRRSCFVIAPVGAEVSHLLEVLRDHRCEPFFISDYLNRGRSTASEVRAAFRSVDFVIALLLANHPLENVFFELGLAFGLGRRLLIIAEPGAPHSFDIARFRVQLISHNDRAAVANTVEDYFKHVLDIDKPSLFSPQPVYAVAEARTSSSERYRNEKLAAEIERLRNTLAEKSPTPEWLESQILLILTSAGFPVAEAPEATRRRSPTPDLALWMDSIQREIGNPIAIEVKLVLPRHRLEETINRLAMSLRSVDAKAGILLHAQNDLRLPSPVIRWDPLIFVFSIDEFLPLLEAGKLDDHLKRLARSTARKP